MGGRAAFEFRTVRAALLIKLVRMAPTANQTQLQRCRTPRMVTHCRAQVVLCALSGQTQSRGTGRWPTRAPTLTNRSCEGGRCARSCHHGAAEWKRRSYARATFPRHSIHSDFSETDPDPTRHTRPLTHLPPRRRATNGSHTPPPPGRSLIRPRPSAPASACLRSDPVSYS